MFSLAMFVLLLCLPGLLLLCSLEVSDIAPGETHLGSTDRPAFLDAYFRQFARDLSLDESDFLQTLARVFY